MMKKTLILAAILMLSAVGLLRADSITFQYSTSTYGGGEEPNNITAAWVEDSNNNFVRTLVYCATVTKTHKKYLDKYIAKAGANVWPSDARMGPTRKSHRDPVTNANTTINRNLVLWDLKDAAGNTVPSGTYTFWMQMTASNNSGRFTSVTFDIDGSSRTENNMTPTSPAPNFNSISIVYDVTGTTIDAPVANNKTYNIDQDTNIDITLTASDSGGALTYNITQNPANGTLTGTPPDVTYQPNPGWTGRDTFKFTATEAGQTSNIATIAVNVAAVVVVNNDPVIESINVTDSNIAYPATSTTVSAIASDAEDSTLTYTWSKASGPSTVTFSPNSGTSNSTTATFGAAGTYTLELTVSDSGNGTDSMISNSITVLGNENTAPIATNLWKSTGINEAVGITLAATDGDGDALTYTHGNATHGTITGSGKNLTYTPVADYSGPDSFTFQANDGIDDSNTATVNITVTDGGNIAPFVENAEFTVVGTEPTEITVVAGDADGDPLTYTNTSSRVSKDVSKDEVTGTGPTYTYTAESPVTAAYTTYFHVKVNDGTVDSPLPWAKITINVVPAPPNAAPVVANDSLTVVGDAPASITVTATDADGDALTYAKTQPANGTVTGTGPTFTYTANSPVTAAYTDTFQVKANDGTEDSSWADITVSVELPASNTAPVVADDSLTVVGDAPASITVTATDADGDSMTFTKTQPANGTVTGAGPTFTYTANSPVTAAYTDTFRVRANDGKADSAWADITVSVQFEGGAVELPTIANLTAGATAGSIQTIVLPGSGPGLTYTYTQPASGTVAGNGPVLTYTAPEGFEGTETFTYTVSNGTEESTADVEVEVARDMRKEYERENVADGCAMSATGNSWLLPVALLLAILATLRLKMRQEA